MSDVEAEADTSGDRDELPDLDKPELGHLAQWAVSSHKYGFGVENLKDGNENTFWQSEGPQPHTIDLAFPRRVLITSIALLTSHPRDDSYTPSKISIRAGTSVHDLQEYQEFDKPNGWITISLRPMDNSEEGMTVDGPPIPCHHIRIMIIANHLNGKDTHIRGLKVFGSSGPTHPSTAPLELPSPGTGKMSGKQLLELGHDGLSGFTSQKFKMHEWIR